MPRGYQINIEKGFDELVAQSRNRTLLQLVNSLDKQLEAILAAPKADTIKLVHNIAKAQQSAEAPQSQIQARPAQGAAGKQASRLLPETVAQTLPITYSEEQKALARSKRESDTRQLEARLGRLPQFFKSSDGIVYTLPLEPRKRDALPIGLRTVKTARLFVPLLYNLEPCRVELVGISREDAVGVEKAFKDRAMEYPQLSLLSHINYFSQNMHVLASQTAKEAPSVELSELTISEQTDTEPLEKTSIPEATGSTSAGEFEDRRHIVTIARPPEWNVTEDDSEEDSDSSFGYDSDEESEEDHDRSDREVNEEAPASTPERGILISFPFLELHGIELLELVTVNLTIKCDRCKDTMDVSNIKNNVRGDYSGVRSESCKKCANPFGIGN